MRDTQAMNRAIFMVRAVLNLLDEERKPILEAFPRDLEQIILYTLEVPVERLPNLTLSSAQNYLCTLSGDSRFPPEVSDNRRLYGLLHVGPPFTVIFVCSDLHAYLQNYVLAHELGHLLADVFLIQQLWIKTLPEQKNAIQKLFTWDDSDPWLELTALIKGLPRRPRAIIGRDQNFEPETSEREDLADLFAREIIAPWDIVAPLSRKHSRKKFAELMCNQFGLPPKIAARYYDDISRYFEPSPGILERLFCPLVVPAKKKSTEC